MKYFIYTGELGSMGIIGIKYITSSRKVIIGSYNHYESEVVNILKTIFNVDAESIERKQTQKNKFRYKFYYGLQEYSNVILKLENNYTVKHVKSLERVMR